MPTTSRTAFIPLIKVAFGAVTGAYAPIGSPLPFPIQSLVIENSLNQDVILSTDGVTDMFEVLAGPEAISLDVGSFQKDIQNGLPKGTQFFIKNDGVAPTSGKLTIQGVGMQIL